MQNNPADWQQLTLAAGAHGVERLEDALLAAGAIAVTLSDGGDRPVLEPAPGATPLWPHTLVTGLFDGGADLAAVKQRLRDALGMDALAAAEQATLAERDWARVWLDDFKPMRFGRRLWVCPGDQPPPPASPPASTPASTPAAAADTDAVTVALDPGLAFGTGTHPTTALCLEWLDGADLGAKTVLDYGCGSGILAVAAAKLGAGRVWAIDIDPQALLAGRDNAARNGVADRLWLGTPEQLAATAATADVVVANILAGPLIELAPKLTARLRPGGALALSGLLADQAAAVSKAYRPWLELKNGGQRDGWVLLYGHKPSA